MTNIWYREGYEIRYRMLSFVSFKFFVVRGDGAQIGAITVNSQGERDKIIEMLNNGGDLNGWRDDSGKIININKNEMKMFSILKEINDNYVIDDDKYIGVYENSTELLEELEDNNLLDVDVNLLKYPVLTFESKDDYKYSIKYLFGANNSKEDILNTADKFLKRFDIPKIISLVDSGEAELEEDYFLKTFQYPNSEVVLLGQKVKGYPLDVFFEEHDFVKELREKACNMEITEQEFREEIYKMNQASDQFNFDKVIAYSTLENGLVWL